MEKPVGKPWNNKEKPGFILPRRMTEEKNNTNELKTECPVCGSIINKYQVKRHEESIKHQTKLKGKEQPKVVRNGDDETGMLGI